MALCRVENENYIHRRLYGYLYLSLAMNGFRFCDLAGDTVAKQRYEIFLERKNVQIRSVYVLYHQASNNTMSK